MINVVKKTWRCRLILRDVSINKYVKAGQIYWKFNFTILPSNVIAYHQTKFDKNLYLIIITAISFFLYISYEKKYYIIVLSFILLIWMLRFSSKNIYLPDEQNSRDKFVWPIIFSGTIFCGAIFHIKVFRKSFEFIFMAFTDSSWTALIHWIELNYWRVFGSENIYLRNIVDND